MKSGAPVKIGKVIFVLLLLLGMYTRMLYLSSPLLDTHSWRQTQTAMFARNFYRNGMNIFKPQIDWDGARPGYIESEFQLYPFTVAVVYKIFGLDEKYGRFVAVLFFAGSMILLYLFAGLFLGEWGALLTLFFFVISPLNVFFSRAFMPESTMLFFSIGALYFFTRWVREDASYLFWLSCGFSVFSFLVKIPSLHIGMALFYLAYVKYGSRMFSKKELWAYLIISLCIPAMWYIYAYRLGQSSGLTENIWSIGRDKWGNRSVWLDPKFYEVLLGRISFGIVTFPGILMALYGFILKVKSREEYVFHVWVVAVFLYFYVTAFGNMVHSYYQLPLVPVACFFAAKGCEKFIEMFRHNDHVDKNAALSFLTALLFYCCFSSYRDISPAYRLNESMLGAALETQRLTTSDTLIVACDSSYPEVLYYSDRRGWHMNPQEQRPDSLDDFARKGARVLVISDIQTVLQDASWKAYLDKKTPLSKGSNYAVYKL